MDIENYRSYCSNKKGASESFPFDDKILVYKVAGKIFTLANIFSFNQINVKCAPEKALELRSRYPGIVTPAWHMSKRHWNTLHLGNELTHEQIYQWIDYSYELVVQQLPLQKRALIDDL